MDSTCRVCFTELDETETACPRCGAAVDAAQGDAAPTPPPLESALAEQPPKPSQVIATRVVAVVFAGWLAALAVFAWLAYGEGYVDTVLPLWNTVFFVAILPLVAGIFARRMWAHRWVVGIAAFTGLGNALQASKSGSTLLWIGTVALGVVVLVLATTRPIFRHDNAHRGVVAQALAMIVTVGSVFMFLHTREPSGSERGRDAFVAEVQGNYAKAGATTVRVFRDGRTLVIEGSDDSDAQIDEAADVMDIELRKHGGNAKAWALGFQNIRVTNNRHTRILRAADYR